MTLRLPPLTRLLPRQGGSTALEDASARKHQAVVQLLEAAAQVGHPGPSPLLAPHARCQPSASPETLWVRKQVEKELRAATPTWLFPLRNPARLAAAVASAHQSTVNAKLRAEAEAALQAARKRGAGGEVLTFHDVSTGSGPATELTGLDVCKGSSATGVTSSTRP